MRGNAFLSSPRASQLPSAMGAVPAASLRGPACPSALQKTMVRSALIHRLTAVRRTSWTDTRGSILAAAQVASIGRLWCGMRSGEDLRGRCYSIVIHSISCSHRLPVMARLTPPCAASWRRKSPFPRATRDQWPAAATVAPACHRRHRHHRRCRRRGGHLIRLPAHAHRRLSADDKVVGRPIHERGNASRGSGNVGHHSRRPLTARRGALINAIARRARYSGPGKLHRTVAGGCRQPRGRSRRHDIGHHCDPALLGNPVEAVSGHAA